MQGVKDDCGTEFSNLLDKCRRMQFHTDGGIALLTQRRKDCPARAARYLSLTRWAAHDDDDGCLPLACRTILQLLDQCLPNLENVSCPHCDNKVARAHMLGKIAFEVSMLRQVDGILPRLPRDLLHQRLSADARNRRLPCRVDIGEEQQIGRCKARTELLAQKLRPRVAMRLKDADEACGVRRTRCRQRHGDLRRMVRIVVHHPDTALFALRLEAALCPVEARKCVLNLCKSNIREPCDGNTGERVEHVVPPGDVERNAPKFFPALVHRKGDDGAVRLNVRRTVVRLPINGIGDDAPFCLRRNLTQNIIFKAKDSRAVLVRLIDKCAERLDDLLHRAVVIHVVVLDVRHNGNVRAQLQEGPVTLVRLGDEVAARTELCIRTKIRYLAADDDGRRYAHTVKCHADHRGGRRLAVRARDGDAVVLVDQCRVDIRAVQLWDAQIPRCNHLRVVVGNRRGDHDGIRTAHVLRTLTIRPYTRAETYELLDDGR